MVCYLWGMTAIEPVGTYGVVVDDDVMTLIRELRGGSRYAASDLHRRYSEIARVAGRSPGHPTALGQALRRMGLVPVKMTVGGGGRGRGRAGRGKQISAWLL